jgi:hypothetical protein
MGWMVRRKVFGPCEWCGEVVGYVGNGIKWVVHNPPLMGGSGALPVTGLHRGLLVGEPRRSVTTRQRDAMDDLGRFRLYRESV